MQSIFAYKHRSAVSALSFGNISNACRFAPSVALTAFFLLMSFLSKNTKCFHFSYSLRLILSSRYSVFKVRSAALFPLLWRLRDSNSRPPACKAGALPTELSPLATAFPAVFYFFRSGSRLLSHTVSSIVSSAAQGLTCTHKCGLRVRDGYVCFPWAHRHRKLCVISHRVRCRTPFAPLRVRSWTTGLSCMPSSARPGEQAPRSVLPKSCALGSQQPNSNPTPTSSLERR